MVRRSLRQWQIVMVMFTLVVAGSLYFAYHAFNGRFGLYARGELLTRITALKTEHTELRKERTLWERRVDLLSADKLDPDLLEEYVRDRLNWSHPNDVIIVEGSPGSTQGRP